MLEGLTVPSSCRSAGQTTAHRLDGIRKVAGKLHGFQTSERVLFTPGATWGLNQILHGCVCPGDVVVTSRLEHNAVSRPLHALKKAGAILREVPFDESGILNLDAWQAAFKDQAPRWAVLTHTSNVLGTIQPLEQATAIARAAGARMIADLSQSSGHIPIHLDAWEVSAAVVPGHKGLRGPRGVGLLFVAGDLEPSPWAQGGTGSHGHQQEMPAQFPSRLEPGTANYPGIFGLGAALDWLENSSRPSRNHCPAFDQLDEQLRQFPGVRVFPIRKPAPHLQIPILAFQVLGTPPEVVAECLFAHGVESRAGVHCASGTCTDLETIDGLVRLSPPSDATEQEYVEGWKRIETTLNSLG